MTTIKASDLQIQQLIAHLRDYIQLMDFVWPGKEDRVKSRAKTLLSDLTGHSEADSRKGSNV